MSVKPISPDEVVVQKKKDLSDVVIECWNKAIAKNWNGRGPITIRQDLIVIALAEAAGVNRGKVFENGWLEIESLYRENGWKVEYDKPGYNESYEAYFTFSKKS